MSARDHFRAHGRRRVTLTASMRLPQAEPTHSVRIRDLGLGGACIELRESAAPAIAVDASVVIEVTAPTLWDPLALSGKVAWVKHAPSGRATRAGVRFEHRDASALYALFQLLGAHAYEA